MHADPMEPSSATQRDETLHEESIGVKRERTSTRNASSSVSQDQQHQQEQCQLDHRFRLLPQPGGRSRITKESLSQTLWDALDLAYDLLEEEEEDLRDFALACCTQGLPASEFDTHPMDWSMGSAKRKR